MANEIPNLIEIIKVVFKEVSSSAMKKLSEKGMMKMLNYIDDSICSENENKLQETYDLLVEEYDCKNMLSFDTYRAACLRLLQYELKRRIE